MHDFAGKDVFDGRRGVLGNSNLSSVGVFCKQGGEAQFNCDPNAIAGCFAQSTNSFCLGLFIAENGKFSFKEDEFVGPNRSWVRKKDRPNSHGIGICSEKHISE